MAMEPDTLSTSPNSVRDIHPQFFERRGATKDDESVSSLAELVQDLDAAVQERREKDIEPGSPDDPILMVLR